MKVNQQKRSYLTPTIKMVEFEVEVGMAASPYKIVQPSDDETDGMVEQMSYDANNDLGWDWHIN